MQNAKQGSRYRCGTPRMLPSTRQARAMQAASRDLRRGTDPANRKGGSSYQGTCLLIHSSMGPMTGRSCHPRVRPGRGSTQPLPEAACAPVMPGSPWPCGQGTARSRCIRRPPGDCRDAQVPPGRSSGRSTSIRSHRSPRSLCQPRRSWPLPSAGKIVSPAKFPPAGGHLEFSQFWVAGVSLTTRPGGAGHRGSQWPGAGDICSRSPRRCNASLARRPCRDRLLSSRSVIIANFST
jgi:hypothetical protein